MIYSQFSHFLIHLFIYLFIGYLLLAIIFTRATTEQKSTYHCCLETYGKALGTLEINLKFSPASFTADAEN